MGPKLLPTYVSGDIHGIIEPKDGTLLIALCFLRSDECFGMKVLDKSTLREPQ